MKSTPIKIKLSGKEYSDAELAILRSLDLPSPEKTMAKGKSQSYVIKEQNEKQINLEADNPTAAGKEATDLISRCQKAVDEDQKVLLGFTLSNLTSDIFTLNKGDHAGEQRVSLKVRLIKVDWIKIDQAMVYKEEKSEISPPYKTEMNNKYASNSF